MKFSTFALTLLLPYHAAFAADKVGPITKNSGPYFQRIATFPICAQTTCDSDAEMSAEIVVPANKGRTLVYSNSPGRSVGFVDISDPYNPSPMGEVDVRGEPTSVAVCGDYAVVSVNTSKDFVNTSGSYQVVDIASQKVVATGDLPGQPDSIAITNDCSKAVIAIENERDLDAGKGFPPQSPAGSVIILDMSCDNPTEWYITKDVRIAGLDGLLYRSDPEPEFVSINDDGIAVVTLQENNAIVLIDTMTGDVIDSFSAGTVNLSGVDTVEDGVIDTTGFINRVLREPDGVTWLNSDLFVVANEGDLEGGSRSFTVFDKSGTVVYDSGAQLDTLAALAGHYPERRSENSGNEPENVSYGDFGGDKLLFVTLERASLVYVYDIADPSSPEYIQMLPAAIGPEGTVAIPERNLLVAGSEVDVRGGEIKSRSSINIYFRDFNKVAYPTLVSSYRDDGSVIGFGALSGLAAPFCEHRRHRQLQNHSVSKRMLGRTSSLNDGVDTDAPTRSTNTDLVQDMDNVAMPKVGTTESSEKGSHDCDCDDSMLYAISDSFFTSSRIYTIDTSLSTPTIVDEMIIMDTDNVFARALDDIGLGDSVSSLINSDMSVNIDPEGLTASQSGGFWLVHEGGGTVGSEEFPFLSPNILFKLSSTAVIEEVVLLPQELIDIQFGFGFEGVAEDSDDGYVIVAFQRALLGEEHPRIGAYNPMTGEWDFAYYPLDEPESPNGGWVGLSDIVKVGGGKHYVTEADNQGGPDARIKRVYEIDVNEPEGSLELLTKTFVKDLMPDLAAATNGPIVEKVKGFAMTSLGDFWIVNDNDGANDNSGETLLINISSI